MEDERVSGGRWRGAPAGERRLLLRDQAATFGLFVCTESGTPAHLDEDSRHWFVCVEQPRPPVSDELLLPCLIPGEAAQLQP